MILSPQKFSKKCGLYTITLLNKHFIITLENEKSIINITYMFAI